MIKKSFIDFLILSTLKNVLNLVGYFSSKLKIFECELQNFEIFEFVNFRSYCSIKRLVFKL